MPLPHPCPGGFAASKLLSTSLRPSCSPPQVMDQKLSGQRAALEQGQNPLPLYLSLNVKENNLETLDFKGTVLSPVHSALQHAHKHVCAHTHMHTCTPLYPMGPQRVPPSRKLLHRWPRLLEERQFWWAECQRAEARCPGGGQSGEGWTGRMWSRGWGSGQPRRQPASQPGSREAEACWGQYLWSVKAGAPLPTLVSSPPLLPAP